MLSESMLQRFSTKIGQLVSTQQAERSTSTPQSSSFDKWRQQDVDNKKKQREISPESSCLEEKMEINEQSKKSSSSRSINENEETERGEKINSKQLSRLIALEKQKSQTGIKIQKIPTTVKKSVGCPPNYQPTSNPIPKQPPPAPVKPTIKWPQVSVMNNLLKLSTKLQCHELLKQIKYQALILSMASARFLLYFCIERIIFSIYIRNGAEKVLQKQKDVPFLLKNIQLSLIELIIYFKKPQRSMLTRILQAVFQRFQIFSCFSEKWLTQCIRQNKKMLQENFIDVEQLEKIPSNSSITSNIFLGIPSLNKKFFYDFPSLELEDQDYSQEKIQDPEVFHTQQRLFFYKKSFNKDKFGGKIEKHQIQNKRQKINAANSRSPIYNTRNFKIELPKLSIPGGIKIFRSQQSLDMHETERPSETVEKEIKPLKRNRIIQIEDLEEQGKTQVEKPRDQIMKDQIAKAVEEYIFANIEQIAAKISEKLSMSPDLFLNSVKQVALDGRLPTKRRNNGRSFTQKADVKEQCDDEIIKQIQGRSLELENNNFSHKELVKEIFKLLQNKSLSHQRKEQIMEKWIAYKQQKKTGRK